jgi:hypothetical protein
MCNKCGELKALTEFNKCASHKDGLKNMCKKCQAIERARYKENNPDKWKESKARWQKENRSHCNAYNQLWRDNNYFKSFISWLKDRVNRKPSYKEVEVMITEEELKYLWDRDNAQDMEYPELHRWATHYEVDTCEFLDRDLHNLVHIWLSKEEQFAGAH